MSALFLWIVSIIGETVVGKIILDKLEKVFPKVFKSETKEIVETYERRINEKNSEINRIEKERAKERRQHQVEEGRLIGSLKRRSIATEKLLEQYHKPLNAILISYASQQISVGGKTKRMSFLKDELSRFNSKYLGGTDTLIPPASVPLHLKNQEDLKKWFETDVLKGRYCKIKFIILFDIRKSAFWGTYLPYIQKSPMHFSIGDVLSMEDLFTNEQIDRLAISEIIKSGDIAWLASAVVSESELNLILRNQKNIEKDLGNPSLRTLSNKNILILLTSTLSAYVENAEEVAKAIINEAKFWQEKIKG